MDFAQTLLQLVRAIPYVSLLVIVVVITLNNAHHHLLPRLHLLQVLHLRHLVSYLIFFFEL